MGASRNSVAWMVGLGMVLIAGMSVALVWWNRRFAHRRVAQGDGEDEA